MCEVSTRSREFVKTLISEQHLLHGVVAVRASPGFLDCFNVFVLSHRAEAIWGTVSTYHSDVMLKRVLTRIIEVLDDSGGPKYFAIAVEAFQSSFNSLEALSVVDVAAD